MVPPGKKDPTIGNPSPKAKRVISTIRIFGVTEKKISIIY
jgi:hypothetical protein